MPMFGFDENATLFDATPLSNQFLIEYMPAAKGDYVKVYLYGLLQCYHPAEEFSINQIARELYMEEDQVKAAFRYWERHGLVKRVSDAPPAWQYYNMTQRFFCNPVLQVDEDYERFTETLYTTFNNDRQLTGADISLAYEWVDEFHLPVEAVIALVKYKIETAGKNFSFKSAEKLALELKDEHVQSADEAAAVLNRDRMLNDGTRKIIRRLGKRRFPSQDELNLYRTWTREWGFSHQDIEAACAETTKGEPTMGYLNGILLGLRQRMISPQNVDATLAAEQQRSQPLKALLRVMNLRSVTVNAGTLAIYDQMREIYPDEIILIAGQECGRRNGASLENVIRMLESWKRKGLKDDREVIAYVTTYNRVQRVGAMLNERWGQHVPLSALDRETVSHWIDDLNCTDDYLQTCADITASAHPNVPFAYMARLVDIFQSQGATTPAAAAAAHAQFTAEQNAKLQQPATPVRQGKVVTEQMYNQRENTETNEIPEWQRKRMEEWLKQHAK